MKKATISLKYAKHFSLIVAVICLALGVYSFTLCAGKPWPVWFGLSALFAGLAMRRRKLALALVIVSFLALSLSGRAVATECERRWDCADNECCRGGECLPKSDPRCRGDDPTPTPAPPTPTPTPTKTPTPTPLPPVVTGQVTCDLWGNGGWCLAGARLQLSASDPQGYAVSINGNLNGAPFSCGSSCTLDLPPGTGTAAYTATSASGLSDSDSTTWKYDPELPVVGLNASGTSGENGWYISPVEIIVTGSDSISGLASVQISVDDGPWQASPVTFGDGVHVARTRVTDNAGNRAEATQVVKVDATAPTLTLTPSGTSGANGWYVSEVDISAVASDTTSGVALLEATVDEGAAWQPLPVHLVDGVYPVAVRARDNAGNEAMESMTLRTDITSPVSAFLSPENNSVVRGVVRLTGQTDDETSGPAGGVISLEDGATWQPLAVEPTGAWSYDWDTTGLANGVYTLLARAVDVAGNEEATAMLTLIVANQPPGVSLTDWWWIWETGQLGVTPRYVPIGEVSIEIHDPQGGPPARWTYDGDNYPSEIRWDRRLPGGYPAPSGDYGVEVSACDIYGLCASARGTIKIPIVTPTLPTSTPAPTAFPTVTETPAVATKTPVIANTPLATPLAVGPPVLVEEEKPGFTLSGVILWPILGLVGLFMAISSASLSDTRPRALRRLGKTMDRIVMNGRPTPGK